MKNQKYKIAAIILLMAFTSTMILLSCNSNKTEQNRFPSTDSTVFYPVQEYFIDQIKKIDSIAPTIQMLTIENGQKDSVTITSQQLHAIARSFLENNIADKAVKKYYKQSIFLDQTTRSITFNYTTVNTSLPVQSLDVLLDTTTQEVKRIFISKIKTTNDSTIIEKLSWRTNKSFSINQSIELPANQERTRQISVVWNDNN